MENSIYIGLSRQTALRREMDLVANNLANINTPGYKGKSVLFSEFIYQPRGRYENFSEVTADKSVTDFSDGPVQVTNNRYDFAINGPGFFQLETPSGVRYTRHGHFHLNEEGQIVSSQGHRLLDDGGAPLEIPVEGLVDVTVASDGTVTALAGNINVNNQQVAGRIGVYNFDNLQNILHTEGGLYITAELPQEVENPMVVQGAVEQSNVQGVVEMTKMISVLRSYQSSQRLVDSENERIKQLIRALSGLQQ